MNRMILVLFISAALTSLALSASDTRDYLARGERGELPSLRYETALRKKLPRAWQKDVVMRVVHFPPFAPESIAGIIHRQDGYNAFRLEPSLQVWDAINDRKENFSKIRAIYGEKALSDSLAARISAVFRTVLSDPRNYRKDTHIYLDNSFFTFFVGFLPKERLAANTLYFDRGTKTFELLQVSDALYQYVLGKKSEAALEQSVRKVETKLRVH